ncbi:glycosyltransferase [Bacillus sp. CFBP 13597]|nr:glycosyltransferase [Bacillus sp. CFBP 13597]
MIGIYLVVFNQLEDTKKCLASLKANTASSYKLVVIDDASTDGTASFLKSQGYQVIENKQRTSQSYRNNQGLKYFLNDPDLEYIVAIHNDMTFYPNWLDRLVDHYNFDSNIGKLSADSYHQYGKNDPVAAVNFMQLHQYQYRDGNGGPWIMSRRVIEKVGLFDEQYIGCGGYEDWDYNNRVKQLGYLVMITKGSVVLHLGMGTRKNLNTIMEAQNNALVYHKKWNTFNEQI